MYTKKVHLHFVGIGGIGMSGIAHVLKRQGYQISGCDKDLSQQSIQHLKQLGCIIYEGNNTIYCNDENIDILVYSSAIKADNAEIFNARKRGIPTINRALMLAELMRTKYSIAIAGSHGKTTTTSLISHILIEAQKDPTIIIGGHLTNISANARFGAGDFLVAEADESDRSLLCLHATLAIITNIDLEHLETYTDLDDIKQTFKQFLNNVPFYGKAFVCVDDDNVRDLINELPHIKIVRYGLEQPADLTAQTMRLEKDHSSFDVLYKGSRLGTVHLNMPGKHNILNALAAILIAIDLEVPFAVIQKALAEFKGIDRRFSYKGTHNGIEIFDDYGHHPEEIRNTLHIAKKRAQGKLIVVFQPHRFTRTQKLWRSFIDVFAQAPIDHLLITDIHAASEEPIPFITSEYFTQDLMRYAPHLSTTYIPFCNDFESMKRRLLSVANKHDLVLLLGAGKINQLAKTLMAV